jgi:hypothetical protein
MRLIGYRRGLPVICDADCATSSAVEVKAGNPQAATTPKTSPD